MIYDFHCNWSVPFVPHPANQIQSLYLLTRAKVCFFPCVCLCVYCVLPGAQPCLDLHTGGSRHSGIMKSSMEVTEWVAGMQLNSAQTIWSTVLSVTHIHKRVHFHTHLLHRHIYSALTELQTDVTFKQQSPGGKNNVCTYTAHQQTADCADNKQIRTWELIQPTYNSAWLCL